MFDLFKNWTICLFFAKRTSVHGLWFLYIWSAGVKLREAFQLKPQQTENKEPHGSVFSGGWNAQKPFQLKTQQKKLHIQNSSKKPVFSKPKWHQKIWLKINQRFNAHKKHMVLIGVSTVRVSCQLIWQHAELACWWAHVRFPQPEHFLHLPSGLDPLSRWINLY